MYKRQGWGRTAAAWTLVRIPNWRRMSPAQLGAAIERTLHAERRDATRVVERNMPYLGESAAGLAPTVPLIAWQMFGGLGVGERVSWLVWTWTLALLLLLSARSRRESGAPAREWGREDPPASGHPPRARRAAGSGV